MAARRPSRSASRSSPRSSPTSARAKLKTKSAPTASVKRSSSLRQSTTPASQKRPSAKQASAGRNKAAKREDDLDSATGLTPTPSPSSSDAGSEDEFDPPSSDEDDPVEEEELDEKDDSELDSDFLDEEDDEYAGKGRTRKSNGGGGVGGSGKKVKTTPSTGRGGSKGKVRVEGFEDEDEMDEEVELEEGQEIAGRIYPAPKSGQGGVVLPGAMDNADGMAVPPGRISHNTFNFLKNLQIPERNDRDWFRAHEPAFRQAEKVGRPKSPCSSADNSSGMASLRGRSPIQIPREGRRDPHPPSERCHCASKSSLTNLVPLIPDQHRIYRDVRFSSDKTPYKRNFSMSTSRGGRKGIWAGYYLQISPNQKSILACGIWQPGKNELQTIRHHLHTEPERFRQTIGHPDFVRSFGAAKPHPKGKRQNVFGHEDALKVAPKGVEKGHKDIDLLKLRSVAVVHE